MKKSVVILISLSFILLSSFGFILTRQGDKNYVDVPFLIEGKDAPEVEQYRRSLFIGNSFDRAVNQFANILKENQRSKREQQKLENAREQSRAKLSIIRTQYDSYTEYPEQISDGWHGAIATDNMNFCKDVKVLVKNNRIERFVIDNSIPINFSTTGSINNAKCVITLQNFNKEQLNIVEVYFLYDIESQNIVQKPINPGFVCFWSDLKNYDDIILFIDGITTEKIKARHMSEPDLFSDGCVIRILKPGMYNYRALGRGAIDWEDSFEVKSGKCLNIRLGR